MTYITGPNYRRAREIKSQMDDVRRDIEDAETAGNFSQVADLMDSLKDLERSWFLTGVTSEYEL